MKTSAFWCFRVASAIEPYTGMAISALPKNSF